MGGYVDGALRVSIGVRSFHTVAASIVRALGLPWPESVEATVRTTKGDASTIWTPPRRRSVGPR